MAGDDPAPSAAEIEAAVASARHHLAGGWGTSPAQHDSNARVLLHLHATIATLTARAEAAEALLVVRQRDIDEQVRCGEAREAECEALAARVATLEAALRAVSGARTLAYAGHIADTALAPKPEAKP